MATWIPPGNLRIVLVGKTGAGKSSTGNTICGRRVFKIRSMDRPITFGCMMETAKFDGQLLTIVDTPGLFDPSKSNKEVAGEIANGVKLAAPGPHVLLVVLRPGKFTNEEQEAVKIIQRMFGEKAACFTMALFTRGDDLEAEGVSARDLIHQSPDLRAFISQCGGGYHVFNNRDEDRSQVRELLEKITSMVQRNGGSCYTTEMLKEAERAIEGKKEKLMREDPNMKPEEARRRAEKEKLFLQGVLAAVGAAAGAAGADVSGTFAGAAVGAVAGPVGAVIGAAVGAAAGVALATVIAAKKKSQKKEKSEEKQKKQ